MSNLELKKKGKTSFVLVSSCQTRSMGALMTTLNTAGARSLIPFSCLDGVFECRDSSSPGRAVLIRPVLINQLNRHYVEIQSAYSSLLLRNKKTRFAEQLQMLHYTDATHGELVRDIAYATARLFPNNAQNFPPYGIRQGMKNKALVELAHK